MAEIGAMSRDIPFEAKILVKRIRSDPNVDINNHWKLITILIGPNDFCSDFCYLSNPETSVENHRRELIETLRTLRDNLPRTIVNVVTPPSKLHLYMALEHFFKCDFICNLSIRHESNLSIARKTKRMCVIESL